MVGDVEDELQRAEMLEIVGRIRDLGNLGPGRRQLLMLC